MGSFQSKTKVLKRNSAKSDLSTHGIQNRSISNIFLGDTRNPPILPESPVLGLTCNHIFLKAKGGHPLCSKCGCVISSPKEVLKRISSENKRKEELKLKVKAQINMLENERNNRISIQGQGNEETFPDSFIEYPPIEPGLIPLDSLPLHFNRESESGGGYQLRPNLKTIQEEEYFLDKSKPQFMTIRSGRPKGQSSLHNEF